MDISVDVSKTKSGLPCIWECGGGMTSTGRAQVICKSDGGKKTALALSHRSLEGHALFVLNEGDLIIKVFRSREGLKIIVAKVNLDRISEDRWSDYGKIYRDVRFDVIMTYSDGEWDKEPSQGLEEAIKSAVEKSRDYHCRSAYWYLPPKKRY